MQRVFVQHVDTPASQAVANQLAKQGKYRITASLYDYSEACFQITSEQVGEAIEVFSQDDLYSDIFVEYLLQTDIFVLTPFDIALTLKLLQLIQQSCRSVRIVFLAPYLTLSQAEPGEARTDIKLDAPCLPIYNTHQYLIKKIDKLVHRKSASERQITGQVVYYGMVYNSFACSFNPFAELCNCVKMTRVYPHFTNDAFQVPLTHSGRIAMYVTRFYTENTVVVDAQLTYHELCQSLYNGIFGYTVEVPQEQHEQAKPKTPSKASAPRATPTCKANYPLGQITVTAGDYSMNRTFEEVIAKLRQQEKAYFDAEREAFLAQYKDKPPVEASLKSPARGKGLKTLECEPELPVYKSKYDFPSIPLHALKLYEVISLYTYYCLLYTTALKLPVMDDFSRYSFKAFLNYQESEDPVIKSVQSILLSSMVTEIPQITRNLPTFLELFAYRQIVNKDVFLCGNASLNDLESKIAFFRSSTCYKLVSPADALRFVYSLGEGCKNQEFWEGYLPSAEAERGESGAKAKRGEQAVLRATDFIAFLCRLILAKSVSPDAKDPFYDTVTQAFSGDEDAHLLAFAVALHLVFTNRAASLVYYGFDANGTTVQAFNIIKTQGFAQILKHFSTAEYSQYYDAKKVPQPQKGQIALGYIVPPKQRADDQPLSKSNAQFYWYHPAFADNARSRTISINPLLHEIITNGSKSELAARKQTYEYYKTLADVLQEELHIVQPCNDYQAEYFLNITELFSTLGSAIPGLPRAFDVSALFVSKKQLYTAYLMHFNSSKSEPLYEQAQDATKKAPKDKGVIPLTQNEIDRNEAIQKAYEYNTANVYKLLKVLGNGQYIKLLYNKPKPGIQTLEQIWQLFGYPRLENELFEHNIASKLHFVGKDDARAASAPSVVSYKSKASDISKPYSELRIEKQKSKNGIQPQPSQGQIPQMQEEVDVRLPHCESLFSEYLKILHTYSQGLSSKLQEAEVYYDYLAKEEAEQERLAKMKLYGIGESNFDNNSFGDMAEHSDDAKAASIVSDYQGQRTPRKVDVKASPKQSPKGTAYHSPKASPGAKKFPSNRGSKDEKREVDEQYRLYYYALAEKAEAEYYARLERQQKLRYFKAISDANDYLQQTGVYEDVAQALAALILAVEAGLVESGEHLTFLGEELLQIREEKRASASGEVSASNEGHYEELCVDIEDPVCAEMENCVLGGDL